MKRESEQIKSQNTITLNPAKSFFKVIRRFFAILLLIFLLAIIVAGTWFYFTYGKHILELQRNAKKIASGTRTEDFKEAQTSLVYASDGSLISVLKAEKDVYYLEYTQIPKAVVSAMLATEDRKFYTHGGYDLLANVRASILLIKNKGEIHQGASTITQQLARTVYLTNEVTWERKITELFLAAELEKKYTKDQIMEFYLNSIYFANGHYGVQAAAYGYFNRSVSELSISEIAFICTIPNNPTIYNPVTNFDNTMERRDKVLSQMYDEGYISEKEYKTAIKEDIVLDLMTIERKNYAESYTYYCAIRALMEREGFVFRNDFIDNDDKEEYEKLYYESYYRIQKSLYTKGYRIYTSIDLDKQKALQDAINNNLSMFDKTTDEGIYELQASAVCIDNDTGKVIAIVGGREQEYNGYTLNRAYQSFRQPGSAIKPLIVYTPLFEKGVYPDNMTVDEKFEGSPRNADGSYAGEITIRRAVEVSKNTVAWKLFLELTPQHGLSYLKAMNFSRIVDTDYVPAASIGGLTYGVSSLEMASAYTALENEGVYRNPTCIIQIMDAKGNALLNITDNSKRIYDRNASLIMTDVLKGVMTNGTGRKLQLNNMTSAGKTGTTGDQRDGWFCGYTRYYTTAVWVGYDMPRTMEGLAGNTYPGYVYKDFMNQIHEGLADKDFEKYIDNRPVYEQIWGEEERNEYEEQDKYEGQDDIDKNEYEDQNEYDDQTEESDALPTPFDENNFELLPEQEEDDVTESEVKEEFDSDSEIDLETEEDL